ncbi:P-type conjugative transfer protein TrbJ [Novosphingobium decolorationis]|uniref:P-type conjugative transfer protein TrbJ n=2 Tax=Novosphingobium decolorationis TaxID=2698673 RepID=A0ABX8EEA4_9SPHN|nr:P-type conjugative transfer protein TrbJ [Novosphingobium decolorationis]QVM86306.1 P-type conjugative transfer protein TrbJ [Novosphingobium decolorationis]
MKSPPRLITLAAALAGNSLLATGLTALPAPAHAQFTVFDPSNYAQNILTATRTLQQVNQQVRQLQNEAQMLVNQSRNLAKIDFPQLDAIRERLAEIDTLMDKASGIDFNLAQTDAEFENLFPRDFSSALQSDARVRSARSRLGASLDAYRQTMRVQSGIVASVGQDAQTLADIAARSQSAEGALQAQQATNQLLALVTKQQFQLQQLMAAQFRSEATEQARRETQAAEARAATKKFLGTGSAYTPEQP